MPDLDDQAIQFENQAKEIAELKKSTAETQKAAVEAQKATIEAQKALIDAYLPKGETEGLAGEITTVDFGYVAELVAYETIKESAKSVGADIDKLSPSQESPKILIVPDENVAKGDLPLLQLDQQFRIFASGLDTQIATNNDLLKRKRKGAPVQAPVEPGVSDESTLSFVPGAPLAASAVLAAAAAFVSATTDIVGYFKVNYDIKGQNITLKNDAITAIVASTITKFEIHILNFNMINRSDIVKRFTDLIEKKQHLETTTDRLKIQIVDPLTTADSLSESDQQLLAEANTALVEAGKLAAAFDVFMTSITSSPEANTPSLLVQAALREYIKDQKITHLLHLNILSSGGEAITKKSLWSSGDTTYIGGSVISYILATCDGQVVSADTKIALAQLNYKLSSPESATLKKIPLFGGS